jgi:hypothetical protein
MNSILCRYLQDVSKYPPSQDEDVNIDEEKARSLIKDTVDNCMKGGEAEDFSPKQGEKKQSKENLSQGFPIAFTYVEKEEDELLWKKMRIKAKKSWVDHHFPLAKSGPGWCRAQVMPSRWKPKTNKMIKKEVLEAPDIKKINEIVVEFGFCSSVEEVDAELERTFPEIEKEIEKIKEETNTQKCLGCGGEWKYRCPGCFLELYCGKTCQVKMWKEGHKTKCKETREEFKRVIFTPVPRSKELDERHKLQTRLKKLAGDVEKKESSKNKFVVKVVYYLDYPEKGMIVKNENETVYGGFLRQGQEEIWDKLMKALMEKGVRGIKGVKVNFKYYAEFFFAIFKGVSKEEGLFGLEINPVRVQPGEFW